MHCKLYTSCVSEAVAQAVRHRMNEPTALKIDASDVPNVLCGADIGEFLLATAVYKDEPWRERGARMLLDTVQPTRKISKLSKRREHTRQFRNNSNRLSSTTNTFPY